jgi:undecaprenyl-diphosphatase
MFRDALQRVRRSLAARETIALTVSVVIVLVFVALAEAVHADRIKPFDLRVATWLYGIDSSVVDVTMRAFSFAGSVPMILVVVVAAAGWAYQQGARRLAGTMVGVAGAASILNMILKSTFERPRPDLFADVILPASYSFPSGHTAMAAATYGMAAVVIARLRPASRRLVACVAVAVILLIGISRVALGVHWPTDVIAGLLAGGLVLGAGVLALGPSRRPDALTAGSAAS